VARHSNAAHLAADTSANRHQDDRECDRDAESAIDHCIEAGIVLVVVTARVAPKAENGKDVLKNVRKRGSAAFRQSIEFSEAIFDNETLVKMRSKHKCCLVGCDASIIAAHKNRKTVSRFHSGEGIGFSGFSDSTGHKGSTVRP
jgi:hypothetical protein